MVILNSYVAVYQRALQNLNHPLVGQTCEQRLGCSPLITMRFCSDYYSWLVVELAL